MESLVKFGNRITNNSYISNLKAKTFFDSLFGGYYHYAKSRGWECNLPKI